MIEDDDAIGELERFLLIVGHEHARQADLLVQPAQPAAQLLPDLGVERPERLVEQEHRRLAPPAPARARRAAAGRPRAPTADGAPRKSSCTSVEQFVDAGADLISSVGPPIARPHAQAERDVLEHASCGGRARSAGTRTRRCGRGRLAPVASSPSMKHGTLVGALQPGDDAQQRRLARPRRAEQREELARSARSG